MKTREYQMPTLAQQCLYLAFPGSTAEITFVQAFPEVTASQAENFNQIY